MSNRKLIDEFSWAFATQLMDLFEARVPEEERPDAFFTAYVLAIAILECFDEQRRAAAQRPGVSKN
jgi:hypothetical protein